MTTAVRQGDLKNLGQLLQESLELNLFASASLVVRCARRQNTLMVDVQHPEDEIPASQEIFSFLELTIKTQKPDWAQKGQVYLRLAGQQQPYAFHTFNLPSVAQTAKLAADINQGVSSDSLATSQTITEIGVNIDISEPAFAPDTSTRIQTETLEPYPDLSDPWEEESEPPKTTAATASVSTEEPETTPLPQTPVESEAFQVLPPKNNPTLPGVLAGAAVSFLVLFAIVYPLTRPCVLGKCEELNNAKDLNEQAEKLLEEAKTADAPLQARQNWKQATSQLKTIPFWSFYYPQAQKLSQNYEQQSQQIDQLLEIQKKATQAVKKSLNPPHSLQTWQEVQTLWQEAIAAVEKLPEDSTTEGWKQRKLQEYQTNLATINKRINLEQQADNKLKTAKAAAQLAETRQSVAQSLESWQLVYATWQTAVATLKQVPKGTSASEEAKQLIDTYQTKLSQSRNRKTTEEKASSAFSQSQRLAETAQALEQKNQWTQAVTVWRKAISSLQEVPSGTDYYNQAQPLKDSYSNSLERAKSKLQQSVVLQKIRTDLKNTCGGVALPSPTSKPAAAKAKATPAPKATATPKVCDYSVTSDNIAVYITPEYQRAIRQAAISADRKNDNKTRSIVSERVQKLQTSLEQISNQAGIPIQVFDPAGASIGSYNPVRKP